MHEMCMKTLHIAQDSKNFVFQICYKTLFNYSSPCTDFCLRTEGDGQKIVFVYNHISGVADDLLSDPAMNG